MRTKKSRFTVGVLLTLVAWALLPTPATHAVTNLKVLHRFTGADGATPLAGLVFDAAGNLYGTTTYGGDLSCSGYGGTGCGTVFKLSPSSDGTWTESVLHSFTGQDGEMPEAGLIFDAAGNLYGTTTYGGASYNCIGYPGCGAIFKMSPNSDGTWTESVLYSFKGEAGLFYDGQSPVGSLIFDPAGNLYGTTILGGDSTCGQFAGGCGIVFKLTPNSDGSWTESLSYSFNGTDGEFPSSRLIFDPLGNLYGTTQGGTGSSGYGATVFKLAPNPDGSWTEGVLHAFSGLSDGQYPLAGLILDVTGNLYGTTQQGGIQNCIAGYGGCGLVFKLTQKSDGSWKKTVLHMFAGKPVGDPAADLIFDAAGNIYGTASGPTNGAVFKMTPGPNGRWAYSILQAFSGKPGSWPTAPVVLDNAGNLYGTTSVCGPGEGCDGIVFEIRP